MKFVENWARCCGLPSAGSIGHFLTACLEWIIEKRKLPAYKDTFMQIKLEYSKQRDSQELKDLLSKTDYAILDSVLLGDKLGSVYDHHSYVESCKQFSVGSSLNLFEHMHTCSSKLSFDYLDRSTVLCKVNYAQQLDQITGESTWMVTYKESQLELNSPWFKPYLADLATYNQGRERVAFINNYILFINQVSKRAVYNLKTSGQSSITRIFSTPKLASYFLAEVVSGPRVLVKVFSSKIRKPLLTLNCYGIGSKTPTTSSCQLSEIAGYGKVLVYWNTNLNTFDIYSIRRRRLIGHAPINEEIKGLAQFFCNNNIAIIATGSLIYGFRLDIDIELRATLVSICPNMLERKCWWNRSIVLSEEVRFAACGQHVVVYSRGKTIGMQIVSTVTGSTAFVRLFDQPAGSLC